MNRKSRQFKGILIITAIAFIIAIFIQTRHTIAQPTLNIFGMEDGNQWVSDDGSTETVEELDPASYYPREYWVKIYENGVWVGSEMFGISGGELKLWTVFDHDMPVANAFDNGLTVAWYPLSVGEERTTTANDLNSPGLIVTINAKVMAYEQVALNFDTFDTYKIRLTMTASGPGGTSTEILYGWAVPYLGFVQSEDAESSDKVVSFAIGGGTITQDTDADGDGLKDYQELIVHNTNWQDPDSDGDGFSDGDEIAEGTDPNDPKSHPPRAMPWIPLLLLDD
jgi:hypothetical protein